MSFFEDASLVLIPSAQKLSKIYSVKPTDGTGDLTFTRSNDTATRVASSGLIEKVRTNLALYSEDLTNAAYVAQNATITANTSTAPDGTTTADTYNEGTLSTAHRFYQQFTITANAEYGFSFYAKKNTLDIIRLVVNDLSQNFSWFGAQFDLTNGTITATATGSAGGATYIGGSITNVGNGWYRCSVNGTVNTTTALCFVHSSTSTAITSTDDRGGISYTGTSRTYFGWGFQFETGVTTDYIATTTAAVSVGPVANVPRLDYLNSSCPRLLLEPQRTNLATYSEQFSNAAWFKETGNSITSNTIASPDGYSNADTTTATSTNAINVNQSHTSASSSVHTFSIFLKKNNLSEIQVYIFSAGFLARANVNLDNGTITNLDGSGATITSYGNGWYRCSVQATINTGVGFTIGYLSASTTGSRSIYTYGSQLEVGAYATSYIPTLGAAVTRGADAATTASVPSLIGQTEGTIFIEYNRTNTFEAAFFMLSNLVGTTTNAYQNSFYFLQQANGTMVVEVYVAAAPQVLFTVAALSVGTHKMALAYKANDFALYVDGVQLGTDTSGSVPTTNFLSIGGAVDGGSQKQSVNQALLFKTRLSNADLAALTA